MNRPSFAWIGLPVVITLAAWAGCSNNGAATAGTGGSPTTTSVGGGGSGAGGIDTTPGTCLHVDGFCDISAGEGCPCVDCQMTALCIPDLCTDVNTCDHLLDSCICLGCAEDSICGDPGQSNCVDDGKCDSFTEGCHCKDCWQKPACAPRVAACSGGVPDGKCDRAVEDCSCVDCEGTPLCVMCVVDNSCEPDDPCSCVDCLQDPTCTNPASCVNDGVCDAFTEGCECDDCKILPECAPLDGGVEAGADAGDGGADAGAGGAGGAGG